MFSPFAKFAPKVEGVIDAIDDTIEDMEAKKAELIDKLFPFKFAPKDEGVFSLLGDKKDALKAKLFDKKFAPKSEDFEVKTNLLAKKLAKADKFSPKAEVTKSKKKLIFEEIADKVDDVEEELASILFAAPEPEMGGRRLLSTADDERTFLLAKKLWGHFEEKFEKDDSKKFSPKDEGKFTKAWLEEDRTGILAKELLSHFEEKKLDGKTKFSPKSEILSKKKDKDEDWFDFSWSSEDDRTGLIAKKLFSHFADKFEKDDKKFSPKAEIKGKKFLG